MMLYQRCVASRAGRWEGFLLAADSMQATEP